MTAFLKPNAYFLMAASYVHVHLIIKEMAEQLEPDAHGNLIPVCTLVMYMCT